MIDVKKLAIMVLPALSIAVSVQAAVPHNFTSGSPALASQVNENFADLDARVAELESQPASNSRERVYIDIDCSATPDYFIEPPYTEVSHAYTTFNVTGMCTGPLLIEDDGAEFYGIGAGSGIVLPSGIDFNNFPYPLRGAVQMMGAHRTSLNNIEADALAYNSFGLESEGVSALAAVASSAIITDSSFLGGSSGVFAYGNSALSFQGGPVGVSTVVSNFSNGGLLVGGGSNIEVFGNISITSSVIEGSFLEGISVFSGAAADIYNGLAIDYSSPAAERYEVAINVNSNGSVDLLGGGMININGGINISNNSSFSAFQASDINSTISVSSGSVFNCQSCVQSGTNNNLFFTASTGSLSDVTLAGVLDVVEGSTVTSQNLTTSNDAYISTGATLSVNNWNQNGSNRNINFDGAKAIIVDSSFEALINLFNMSFVQLNDSSINNDLNVGDRSFLTLSNVTQPNNTWNLALENAGASVFDSTIGAINFFQGSSGKIVNSSFGGGEINHDSSASVNESSLNGQFNIFPGSSIHITGDGTNGNLNLNTVYLCDVPSVFIEGWDPSGGIDTAIAATGTIIEGCPP